MPCKTEDLVLGVDGGGTKTVCWIAPATANFPTTPAVPSAETASNRVRTDSNASRGIGLLGEGYGGPSNPRAIGLDAACMAIDASINAAFQSAQIPRDTAGRCAIGLAGAADQTVQASIQDWAMHRRIAKTTCVVPDYELVLAAGSPDRVGIALISGTGSLAFGRNTEGETARAGGWGYLLGDDGSGFAIGREAVRRLLTAGDRGTLDDRFERCLLQHFKASVPQDVISAVYAATDPRAALAGVAPLVLQFAENRNEETLEILERAAQDLAGLVVTVAKRLGIDSSPLRLAGTGGVLLGSETLRTKLRRALICADVESEFTLVHNPVAGAVTIATRL